MDRVILHCDCNSFFASVEVSLNPKLKDVPMAVGGDTESRHGIILAKNELAKKYNIKTAETVFSAKRKCPSLVIVPPHHDLYENCSKRINKIYEEYTDKVEKFGIDESWLDVTFSQRLFGSGTDIANTLRQRIKEEIGITISVGVSFNKVFAKLGSDYKKPDATTVILKSNFKDIVYPLPVEDLLYVGAHSKKVLNGVGIKTIGELALADENAVKKLLGKCGEMLVLYARGEDNSPVTPNSDEAKSIGNGMTFRRDLIGRDDISCAVSYLSEIIASRMRKKGVCASFIQVTVKTPDFQSIQRRQRFASPTNLAKEISSKAMEIISSFWDMSCPIRMLTVTGGGILPDEKSTQICFFDDENDNKKRRNLENAIDLIRAKYGDSSIKNANIIDNDLGI